MVQIKDLRTDKENEEKPKQDKPIREQDKTKLQKLQCFSAAGIRGAFQRIKTLGKGSFGKVFLVRRISNHQLYAMKVIRLDGGISDLLLGLVYLMIEDN